MSNLSPASELATEPTTPPRCVNCGAALHGPYCHRCGQETRSRLTVRQVVSDLARDGFNLDHGFLFTARELLLRPGRAVREYLAGRTVPYTGPGKYFLIVAALGALAYVQSGWMEAHVRDLAAGLAQALGDAPGPQARRVIAEESLERALRGYLTVLLAGLVPMLAVSSWIVFRRLRLTFAEHLAFNAYAAAEQILLVAVTLPLVALTPIDPMEYAGVALLVIVGYYMWAAASLARRPVLGALGGLVIQAAVLLAYPFLLGLLSGLVVAWLDRPA